jgi:hypothetical protein
MSSEPNAVPAPEETDGGGVRFGGVRVRKHRMTMGDNPGSCLLVYAAMIRIAHQPERSLV